MATHRIWRNNFTESEHQIAEKEADPSEPAKFDPKAKEKWLKEQLENANWIKEHTGPHSINKTTINGKNVTVAYNPLLSQDENYQIFNKKCGQHPDCYAICNYIKDEKDRDVCADEYNAADQTKWDERVSEDQKPKLLQEADREKERLKKYLEKQKKKEEQLNNEGQRLEFMKRQLDEKKEWLDEMNKRRYSRGYPAISLEHLRKKAYGPGPVYEPLRINTDALKRGRAGERAGGKSFTPFLI